MNQEKIGRFIAECRRAAGLTQAQLAERLGVTDRAVSKWERGRSLPDSSLMLPLCRELGISANDLLSGERVTMENYNEKAEKNLIEMVKMKERSDRQLLALEILIGVLSVIILLGFTFAASFFEMEAWLRIVIIVGAFVISLAGLLIALRLEQVAGYYECQKCHHRYVPSYGKVLRAMHSGRTRYMKCPECKKYSWQKKRISKDENAD